jgi:hypothetical protein
MIFGSGLVVITGPNSVGKSLLFQSLIYGLGLEGMYGVGYQHGLLTRALTDEFVLDGVTHPVRRSSVTVEIENGNGDILTARRAVVGGVSTQLVATWAQPGITAEAPEAARKDYFVRRPHATTGESGFHRLLTEFIGWTLPMVPAFNEREVPLYPEILFPFLAIEQKSGWSGVLPRIPTYLQVRDPLQRGVEFYLGLGLLQRAKDIQRLVDHEVDLRRQFEVVISALAANATLRGARLVGVDGWATFHRMAGRVTEPTFMVIRADTLERSSWGPIETVATSPITDVALTSVHEPGEAQPRPPNQDELNERLTVALKRLRELSGELSAVEETIDMIQTQLGLMRMRLGAVEEERRRYEQLKVLVGLESPVAVATFGYHDCPTCQQSLDGLEHQPDLASLDYEQSLILLNEQAKTLRDLQQDAERSASDQVLIQTLLEREADELRREVKAIRSDLVAPDNFPSVAQLQQRIQEENRRADLQNLRIVLLDSTSRLEAVADDLRLTLTERARLGTPELNTEEQRRLDAWTQRFRQFLRIVGVTSFPVDEVELPVTGKPSVIGYDDVGFQASASDAIRLRWSYALSLMRVSRELGGPHPGVLLMDEPRQQEVENFPDFLSLAEENGSQIILTTSEPVEVIRALLSGDNFQLIELDSYLLQRVVS